MADKAVPDLDMTVGHHLEDAQGQLVWDVYQGQPNTWKLALIDLLKNPRLRSPMKQSERLVKDHESLGHDLDRSPIVGDPGGSTG